MEDRIRDLAIDLLVLVSDVRFEKDIDRALEMFRGYESANMMHSDDGFNDFLIHDYIFENGQRLIDMAGADPETEKVLRSSVVSFFRPVVADSKTLFADLFDGRKYVIETDVALDMDAVYFSRIYHDGDIWFFTDELFGHDGSLSESMIKNMHEKHKVFSNVYEEVSFDDFRMMNTHVLYILNNIYKEIGILETEEEMPLD